ncbi:uncharacterized protein [Narcine bancroftii]|uniref:uncharacterized protein isoform X2 n=1 Tax=Narcine bancroftii TaxID=1343680 RepID=UPI0038310DA9
MLSERESAQAPRFAPSRWTRPRTEREAMSLGRRGRALSQIMAATPRTLANQNQLGVWTPTKLRLLATALGYPRDLLVDCILPDMRKKQRINSEDLQRNLDLGHFSTALNLTWNMKNADYNVAVIKKCIQLLDNGIISFNEILNVRLTFFTYEQPYENGIEIDQDILMKALKMCSRVVAPEKLMHRIKHWKSTYAVKERIQFYEFMDLLLLTESVDNVFIKEEEFQTAEKTSSDLTKLVVIESLGGTRYERLMKHLDKQFYQEERNYGTTTTESKMLTECPLLVGNKQQAVMFQKKAHQWLKTTLNKCPEQQKLGKGRHHFLPLANCQKLNGSSEMTQGSSSPSKSVVCGAKDWTEKQWEQEKNMDDWVWVASVPPLKLGTHTAQSLSPVCSVEELEEIQKKKEELEYQINTVKERAKLELNRKMDFHRPVYRELSYSRQDTDEILMKSTSGFGLKKSELPLIQVNSRSQLISQAAKCLPGKVTKLPVAPRCKDSKCLALKTSEKKPKGFQQTHRGQSGRTTGATDVQLSCLLPWQ